MTSSIIQFNVGGKRYDVAENTLMKFEDTMLAKMVSTNWNKGSNQEPLFIDRNGERFQYILDWYRDGKITVPMTVATDSVKSDASFFGLPENVIIEERRSLDDYMESVHDVSIRLDSLKCNLSNMNTKNNEDIRTVTIKGFAIWAILRVLDTLSLAGIPGRMEFSSVEYGKFHKDSPISIKDKDILLTEIHKIFATLGDELLPSSLALVDLVDKTVIINPIRSEKQCVILFRFSKKNKRCENNTRLVYGFESMTKINQNST